MIESNRTLRGHNFLPSEENLSTWAKLYETEEVKAGDKVIHAHFYIGRSDWFIAEWDEDEQLTFGWCCLNGDTDNGEWGYVSLVELESINISGFVVERDLHWMPRLAREVLPPKAWQWADKQ